MIKKDVLKHFIIILSSSYQIGVFCGV